MANSKKNNKKKGSTTQAVVSMDDSLDKGPPFVPDKSGYLRKRTAGGGLKRRVWHKRWFSLKDHVVEYGLGPDDDVVAPLQVIQLGPACTAEIEGKKKRVVVVVTPHRKFRCRADSAEEALEWQGAFKAARGLVKARKMLDLTIERRGKKEAVGLTLSGGVDSKGGEDKDIIIARVAPGSIAASAGLCRGDIVVELGGRTLSDLKLRAAERLLRRLKVGQTPITVSRRDPNKSGISVGVGGAGGQQAAGGSGLSPAANASPVKDVLPKRGSVANMASKFGGIAKQANKKKTSTAGGTTPEEEEKEEKEEVAGTPDILAASAAAATKPSISVDAGETVTGKPAAGSGGGGGGGGGGEGEEGGAAAGKAPGTTTVTAPSPGEDAEAEKARQRKLRLEKLSKRRAAKAQKQQADILDALKIIDDLPEE